jgi:hypothetical protein
MLIFVKRAFRDFCDFLLWINLIGSAIAGGVVGNGRGHDYLLVGVIIGVVVGIFTNIVVGGFLATFIEMGNDITIIKAAIATTNTSGINMPCQSASTSQLPTDSVLIESGQTLSGVISHKNGHDFFHVILMKPGKLFMRITTDDENGLPHWESYVNVLDVNGKKINTSGRFEFPFSGEVDLPNAGTYTVEITSSKTGRYYLTVQY